MKISEAIELLQEYEDKEQEIVIGWWDKETVEDYLDYDFSLTREQWERITLLLGNNPAGFEYVSETLTELAQVYWEMREDEKATYNK